MSASNSLASSEFRRWPALLQQAPRGASAACAPSVSARRARAGRDREGPSPACGEATPRRRSASGGRHRLLGPQLGRLAVPQGRMPRVPRPRSTDRVRHVSPETSPELTTRRNGAGLTITIGVLICPPYRRLRRLDISLAPPNTNAIHWPDERHRQRANDTSRSPSATGVPEHAVRPATPAPSPSDTDSGA